MDTQISVSRCGACHDVQSVPDFTMAFQPVIDLALGRIDGHEALVRGLNGEGAYSVLAQVGEINRYSFDQACRVRAIELATRLGLNTRLSINFIPNAVYEPRACIRRTLEAAARCGLPHERLTFEIIESEDTTDTSHLMHIIAEYRRQGFQVALDDFGAGYSGLARLALLKPDIIKLDRLIVENCDTDYARRAIIASLASLCRTLGVKLVAEGVETAAELKVIREAGVRFVQGYYFAKPSFERLLTAADIPALSG
jgi:EAL domain-containing protein (putative c-di-GMP-specific phosphodiesterase class I)